MMVVFISQCEKKALARTRRVLDAFSSRIGNNTWQTAITQEGLLAVKKLLSKTASKNTAVSCHWIRSRARTELIWVVGNKHKFDHEGRVPVNYTANQHVYRDDLLDWKLLPVIRALTCLAALLHDWGKTNAQFQKKLSKDYKGSQADRLRHEWISCLLLKAMIINTKDQSSDLDWLSNLKKGELDETAIKVAIPTGKKKPLADLPNIAKLVSWLIVSHHKLPINTNNLYSGSVCPELNKMLTLIDKSWGYENKTAGAEETCLVFPDGLLTNSRKWLLQLQRWAGKLLEFEDIILQAINDGSYRIILHHARLALMLGDHYFSSLDAKQTQNWQQTTMLIANTQKDKTPKQALDQHLVGVYESAKNVLGKLPHIEKHLESSFNTAELKYKSPKKYAWQDIAAKKVRERRQTEEGKRKGFFGINMAGTGCGKTFANAKIMMALSDDGDSLRYILALGLRTLTLQTGDEYRERIFKKSDGTDLAVLIGSKAIADLHYQGKEEQRLELEKQGSESVETLLADSDQVIYQGELPKEGLTTILKSHKDRQLLYAPVLACTIDHIIAATETTRGGRYILPALRLLSSDLVIDEIDDFTGSDSIAIGRLIHLAGMLGRNVLISSATIPPAMCEGYFHAYREGWLLFCKTRAADKMIDCVWVDEFSTQIANVSKQDDAIGEFRETHEKFIFKKIKQLNKQPAKRKAMIINCEQAMHLQDEPTFGNKKSIWLQSIAQAAIGLHKYNNTIDKKTNIKVSFGVVRIANIQPCIEVSRYLLSCDRPSGTEIKVMAYHGRQVLLLRHAQEKYLDKILKRKEKIGEQPEAFHDTQIRDHLDEIASNQSNIMNVIFIVVATPVEEVGRDHDFDWAIIEPSSYRSIIQLAGRVKRHREGEVNHPNIGILQYNLRTIRLGDKERSPRFYFPGYEPTPRQGKNQRLNNGKHSCFSSHDIFKLVDKNLIETRLDAVPRIQVKPVGSETPMACLEHAVISSELAFYEKEGPETLQGYIKRYWHLTALPQYLNRFRQGPKNILLYRVTNEEGKTWFTERDTRYKFSFDSNREFINQDGFYQIVNSILTEIETKNLWISRNYCHLLQEQADIRETSLKNASVSFGELSLDLYESNSKYHYEYNDQLGLYKKEVDDD